jgi:hypothetical protein
MDGNLSGATEQRRCVTVQTGKGGRRILIARLQEKTRSFYKKTPVPSIPFTNHTFSSDETARSLADPLCPTPRHPPPVGLRWSFARRLASLRLPPRAPSAQRPTLVRSPSLVAACAASSSPSARRLLASAVLRLA